MFNIFKTLGLFIYDCTEFLWNFGLGPPIMRLTFLGGERCAYAAAWVSQHLLG